MANRAWNLMAKIVAALSAVLLPIPSVALGSDIKQGGGSSGVSGLNLNLSSTHRTIAGQNPVSVDIRVGGSTEQIAPGALLTPAEYLAVEQVLQSGKQSLVINRLGQATGGNVIINNVLYPQIEQLDIPNRVVVIDDVGNSPSLTIRGDLVNNGSLYAVSMLSSSSSATISALDIFNNRLSTLTTVIPQGGIPGITPASTRLNLNLEAQDDIRNAGTISSSGSLSLSAGNAIFNGSWSPHQQKPSTSSALVEANGDIEINSNKLSNNGLIESVDGNVDIAPQLSTTAAVNNSGGTVAAENGDINVHSATTTGNADVVLQGGDWNAKSINLYAGQGSIAVNVYSVEGQLNEFGNNAGTNVATGNLTLGNVAVAGDPTFYNDNGNVVIGGNITAGEALTIVASGDITANGNYTLAANNGLNTGYDINLIAGAQISATDTASTTVGPGSGTGSSWSGTGTPAINAVKVTGASASGGSINFSGQTINIQSNAISVGPGGLPANAGNVRLIAYTGTTAGTGDILMPNSSIIAYGQSATPNAISGFVNVIAGGTDNPAISLGSITTIADAQDLIGGGINILNSQPAFTAGASSLTFGSNGQITSGNDLTGSTALSNGGILVGSNLSSAGSITVSTLANATFNGKVIAGANLLSSGVLFGTSGQLSVNAAAVTFNQAITLPAGAVTVTGTGNIAFNGATSISGALTASTPSSISITNSVSAGGTVNLSTSNLGTVTVGAALSGSSVSITTQDLTAFTGSISAPGGTVSLAPALAEPISVGVATNQLNSFNVTSAAISSITTGTLTIGSASLTGGITLGSNLAGAFNLNLLNAGVVNFNSHNMTLGFNNVTIQALDLTNPGALVGSTVSLVPVVAEPIVIDSSTSQANSFNVLNTLINGLTVSTLNIGTSTLAGGISLSGNLTPSYNLNLLNQGSFNANSHTINASTNSITIQSQDLLNIGAITGGNVLLLQGVAEPIIVNAATSQPNSLNVTATVLSEITATNLTIGTTSIGGILTLPVNITPAENLTLACGGSINIDKSINLITSNFALTMTTPGAMTHASALEVITAGNLAITAGNSTNGGPVVLFAPNIQLGGNQTASGAFTAIASGNISSDPGVTSSSISANNGVQAFDINMIAGASTTLNPDNSITVNGPSAGGGNVSLSNMTLSAAAQSGNNPGGTVRLVAYAGSSAGANGNVLLDSSSSVLAGGSGTGVNGSVMEIAGDAAVMGSPRGFASPSVMTGLINTAGGSAAGGNVDILTGQPTLTSGTTITFNTQGNISSGNDFALVSSASGGLVEITNNVQSPGQVNIEAEFTSYVPFLSGQLNFQTNQIVLNSTATIAYTANASSGVIGVFNTTSDVQIGSITIPQLNSLVDDLALSPDGKYLYVASQFGSSDLAQELSVVRTSSDSVVSTTILPNSAGGSSAATVLVSPDGQTLYVLTSPGTASGINTIQSFNVSTPANPILKSSLDFGATNLYPALVTMTGNGRTIYVADNNGDKITTINTSTLTLGPSYTINPEFNTGAISGIRIDPTGNQLFLSEQVNPLGTDYLAYVNLSDPHLTFNVVVLLPPGTGFMPSLAANPQGTELYSANANTGQLEYASVSRDGEIYAEQPLAASITQVLAAQYKGSNLFIYGNNSSGPTQIFEIPSVNASTLTLNGGTNAELATSVSNIATQVNNVNISQYGPIAVNASSVITANAFSLGTAGSSASITVAGQLTLGLADNKLVTVGANSPIIINANISAPLSVSNSNLFIGTTGTGGIISEAAGTSINFSAGTIFVGTLDSNVGSVAAPLITNGATQVVAGAPLVAINTSAQSTASGGASINVVDYSSSAVTLALNAAGAASNASGTNGTNGGSISVSSDAPMNGTITSSGGNNSASGGTGGNGGAIGLTSLDTGTLTIGTLTVISSGGTGSTNGAAATATLTAPTVSVPNGAQLSATGTPVSIVASTLSNSGNITVTGAGNAIAVQSSGTDLTLTSGTSVGTMSAPGGITFATGTNNFIVAGSQNFGNPTTINTSGGNITQSLSTAILNGTSFTVNSTGTGAGGSIGAGGAPLVVNAPSLTVTSNGAGNGTNGGSVVVADSSSSSISATVSTSGASGTTSGQAGGNAGSVNLTVSGPVSGTITASGGNGDSAVGGNGAAITVSGNSNLTVDVAGLTITANAGTGSSNGSIGSATLTAPNNISLTGSLGFTSPGTLSVQSTGSGSISQASGQTIDANNLLLSSAAGDIGIINAPIAFIAPTVAANTTGSVFLSTAAAVSIGNSSASSFTITGTSTIDQVASTSISTNSLTITSHGNNVGSISAITTNAPTVIIDTSGAAFGQSGGSISLADSNLASVAVNLNSSAFSTPTVLTPGASGGAVSLQVDAPLNGASGNGINTNGEASFASGGVGGNAGAVTIAPLTLGSVTIGSLSVTSTGGSGVANGTSQPLTINGPSGGLTVTSSLTASSGINITAASGGIVTQVYPADLDLSVTNTSSNLTTIPSVGGLTVSSGASVSTASGTNISINSNAQGTSLTAGTYGQTPYTSFNIIVGGSPFSITPTTQVTPAEWIAAVQVKYDSGTQLLSVGSNGAAQSGATFTLAPANLPVGGLSEFNVPAGVSATVSVSTIRSSDLVTINGSVSFSGAGTITANGNVSGTGAITSGGALTLTSTTGSIGAQGSNLNATASGGALTLSAPSGGIFVSTAAATTLQANASTMVSVTVNSGTLTIGPGGVTGNAITLMTTTSGDILVNNPITASGTNNSVTLSAAGNVTDTAGAGSALITANSVNIMAIGLNIGGASNPINVNAQSLTTSSGNLGTINIIDSLTGTGPVTYVGTSTALALSVAAPNTSLTLGASVTAANIVFSATDIIDPSGFAICCGSAQLTATSGNIGTPGAVPVPFESQSTNMTVSAPAGSIFLDAQHGGGIAATAAGSVAVTAGASTSVSSFGITGSGITIQTTAGDIQVNGPITSTGNTSVNLNAFGNINDISGSGSGLISAQTVSLSAGSGNIGTSTSDPINVYTPNLSATVSTGKNIFIVNSYGGPGPVTFTQAGNSGTTFVNAPATSLTLGAGVTASTAVTLDAFGSVNTGTFTITTPGALSVGTAGAASSMLNTAVGSLTTTLVNGAPGGPMTVNQTGDITILSQNVSTLTITTAGTATLQTGQSDLTNSLNITAGTAIQINSDVGTTNGTNALNTISLSTPSLTFSGAPNNLNANSTINITSTGNLNISGQGTFNAPNTYVTLSGSNQSLTFNANAVLNFNGSVSFVAGNTFNDNAPPTTNPNIVSTGSLTVIAPTIQGGGFLKSDTGALTVIAPTGAGTFAQTGDLVLTQNITFQGNFTILASGNIMATSAVKSISLAGVRGTPGGGSLTIIAGYDFTGTNSPSKPASTGLYSITGPSATGGSVLLPKVSINTGSSFAGANAGSVTVLASGGSDNAGLISLGKITASATSTGDGGTVTLIGQGGVSTGAINTRGRTGGSVTIAGAAPVIDKFVANVQAPFILSGQFVGAVSSLTPSTTNGAAVVVGGAISTGGSTRGGGVTIEADSQISVSGGINTTSATQAGNVALWSLNNALTIGSAGINTSGLSGNSNTTAAGSAGTITIDAMELATGSLQAKGGNNAGTGGGGAGAEVSIDYLEGDPDAPIVIVNHTDESPASISINGFIDTRGGNSTNKNSGAGGIGGGVSLDAAVLMVKGVTSGMSIAASGGTSAKTGVVQATGGVVNIGTFALQLIPTAFNLLSTTRNIPALPGGMFSVAGGAPVNGTRGTIATNSAGGIETVGNKTFVTAANDGSESLTNIQFTITGGTASGATTVSQFAIAESGLAGGFTPQIANATGVRGMVTPAEAVALYQLSRSDGLAQALTLTSTPIGRRSTTDVGIASGGTIFFNADFATQPSNISDAGNTGSNSGINGLSFSKFQVPSGVTIDLGGARPTLNLPTGLTLATGANIDFDSGSVGTINAGAGTINIANGAGISSVGDTLIFAGSSGRWTNNGTITAANLVLARPSASAVTFTMGSGATDSIDAIEIGAAMDGGISMTFKSTSANDTGLNVNFADVPMPLLYQSLATGITGSALSSRSATLSFALNHGAGATTATVGGAIATDFANGGAFQFNPVGALKIIGAASTASNKTTTLQTPITIADGTSLSANTISISTGALLTVGQTGGTPAGVNFTAGLLNTGTNTNATFAASQILKAGSLTLTSTGTGGISINDDVNLTNNGAKIGINDTTTGNIAFGAADHFNDFGGNVVVLTKGNIQDQSTDTYNAVGITNAGGGGIEMGAGTSTSMLGSALVKLAGIYPSTSTFLSLTGIPQANIIPGVPGTNVFRGVLVLNPTNAAGVHLGTGTGATLNFTGGGAMVFDAVGSGTVTMQGTFTTTSSKPAHSVGLTTQEANDLLIDADEDSAGDETTFDKPSVNRAVSY